MEEASGYMPDTANIAIRSLVVVAIRNSLLEDMGTTLPYHKQFQTGHSPIVEDADMPIITSEAIQFFDSAYRRNCFFPVEVDPQSDIFVTLRQAYPVTWNIFRAASQLTGGQQQIPQSDSPPPVFDFPESISMPLGIQAVTSSGIDPRYDHAICEILSAVRTGSRNLVFFPTFKWLTRLTEKLFRVFEFILCSGARIVTLNYCFSRDSICKRRFFLRPPHYVDEIAEQLRDTRGLCKQHREALALIKM